MGGCLSARPRSRTRAEGASPANGAAANGAPPALGAHPEPTGGNPKPRPAAGRRTASPGAGAAARSPPNAPPRAPGVRLSPPLVPIPDGTGTTSPEVCK